MPGLVLDRVASVWRTIPDPSQPAGYLESRVFSAIRCAIVPVSREDAQQMYSLQSTHLIWVESWLQLRKEDEIRWGRRLPDAFGNVNSWVYVVNGRRYFSQTNQSASYFASERD